MPNNVHVCSVMCIDIYPSSYSVPDMVSVCVSSVQWPYTYIMYAYIMYASSPHCTLHLYGHKQESFSNHSSPQHW